MMDFHRFQLDTCRLDFRRMGVLLASRAQHVSWTGWFEQRIPSSVCCTCRTTIPPACPNFNVSTRVSERGSRYICLAKLKHDSFGSQTLTYWQKPTAKLRSRNCVARNPPPFAV